MQLFLNTTSPFARLARVAALEKGLGAQLQLVWSDPWGHDAALLAAHPQNRIPVLVTDDGHAISESLLIAHYLDQAGSGPALVPSAQHGAVLARTSVAYGLMESAFQLVIARKYDGAAATQSSLIGQRRMAAIARVLAQLESVPPAPMALQAQQPATLDQLTCAIALAYVQFRLPELLAPSQYPQLTTWLAHSAQRPSLATTAFGG